MGRKIFLRIFLPQIFLPIIRSQEGNAEAETPHVVSYCFNPRTKLSIRARPFSMFAMPVA